MAKAIVLAAGSGSRMKSDIPKQFMLIKGKEVVYYSLAVFEASEHIDEIVLVTKEEDVEFCKKEIVDKYGLKKVTRVVPGGENRYDSVYNGLMEFSEERDEVLVHDAARPFVTEQMIEESIALCKEYNAVTVGMPVKDTIKIIDKDNMAVETPDRNILYQVQTPQTFTIGLLREAYKRMYADQRCKPSITDDTMLVEYYMGIKTRMLKGSYNNIKITTPEDIAIAERILED